MDLTLALVPCVCVFLVFASILFVYLDRYMMYIDFQTFRLSFITRNIVARDEAKARMFHSQHFICQSGELNIY